MNSINNRNESLSRCGQCLELVCPTLKTIACVVTQTFQFNGTPPQFLVYNLVRSIGVSTEMFQLLTTNTNGTDKKFNQITIRQTNCKYSLKPKLHLVNSNNTVATLQIVNSNKLIEKIVINLIDYYISSNAHFYVPTFFTLKKIHAYSIDGNCTSFYNVNLTSTSNYLSDTLMPIDKYDRCLFIIEKVVYSTITEYETFSSFTWFYFLFDEELYLTQTTVKNNQLLYTSNIKGHTGISFGI